MGFQQPENLEAFFWFCWNGTPTPKAFLMCFQKRHCLESNFQGVGNSKFTNQHNFGLTLFLSQDEMMQEMCSCC